MPNPDNHRSSMIAAAAVGRQLTNQESAKDERQEVMGDTHLIPLHRIIERKLDSRKLAPRHVESLMESIAALGLVEPLVVDRCFRLLAGGHRLAALRRLAEEDREVYLRHHPDGMVPVRVMPVDAETNASAALAIEIAENQQRKNYTPAEVQKLVHRLLEAGYQERRGRPKAGEKAIGPVLEAVIGCSTRTVRRRLKPGVPNQEMVTDVTISQVEEERRFAARISRSLDQAVAHYEPMGADAESLLFTLRSAGESMRIFLQKLSPEAQLHEQELDA